MLDYTELTPEQFERWVYFDHAANPGEPSTDYYGISVDGVHYLIPGSLVREHQKSLHGEPKPPETLPVHLVNDFDEYLRVLERRLQDDQRSLVWSGLIRR